MGTNFLNTETICIKQGSQYVCHGSYCKNKNKNKNKTLREDCNSKAHKLRESLGLVLQG